MSIDTQPSTRVSMVGVLDTVCPTIQPPVQVEPAFLAQTLDLAKAHVEQARRMYRLDGPQATTVFTLRHELFNAPPPLFTDELYTLPDAELAQAVEPLVRTYFVNDEERIAAHMQLIRENPRVGIGSLFMTIHDFWTFINKRYSVGPEGSIEYKDAQLEEIIGFFVLAEELYGRGQWNLLAEYMRTTYRKQIVVTIKDQPLTNIDLINEIESRFELPHIRR